MSISDPDMTNDERIHERVFDRYGERPDKLGPCWGMDNVMQHIYDANKMTLFRPGKHRYMTFAKFFEESIFFDTNLFNSGAQTTRALARACEEVIKEAKAAKAA